MVLLWFGPVLTVYWTIVEYNMPDSEKYTIEASRQWNIFTQFTYFYSICMSAKYCMKMHNELLHEL